MTAVTEAEVSPWEPRLMRGTAILLRSRTRAVHAAVACLIVGIVVASGAVALAVFSTTVPLGIVVAVALLAVVGLAGLILAGAFAQQARRQRFCAEGAALSVLLPGPTAFAARRSSGLLASLAVAVFGVLAVILVIDHAPLVGVRIVGASLSVALFLTAAIARLATERRAAAEYRAGYTTLTPAHHAGLRGGGWTEPDVRTGVDLVDARSGAVLRADGAAGISVRECARRRAAAADGGAR